MRSNCRGLQLVCTPELQLVSTPREVFRPNKMCVLLNDHPVRFVPYHALSTIDTMITTQELRDARLHGTKLDNEIKLGCDKAPILHAHICA